MPRAPALFTNDARHQFTCCLCLHVRTGTIIFGITQIIIQLVFISFLFLMTFNPRLIPEDNHGSLDPSQANVRKFYFILLLLNLPVDSLFFHDCLVPTNHLINNLPNSHIVHWLLLHSFCLQLFYFCYMGLFLYQAFFTPFYSFRDSVH